MDLFDTGSEHINSHILTQFNDPLAQQELRILGPEDVDWVERTQHTLDVLLPRLPALATYLVDAVPHLTENLVETSK